jgi:predicted NAD/FAD-dependent oxidoreductase
LTPRVSVKKTSTSPAALKVMPIEHPERIAVIGAGLSGLSCANALAEAGASVQVYDKGRGPGGRTSTRHVETAGAELSFDHGAQYFTVRHPRIEARARQWARLGVVAPWEGRVAVLGEDGRVESYSDKPRFVGTPTMSAICKHLAVGRDVRCGVTISRVERVAAGITLFASDGNDLGTFDRLVCTAPPSQTAALLADVAPTITRRALDVVMKPCWALMAAFEPALDVPFDGAFINQGALSWIARMGSKPRRPREPDAWVLHASAEWSTAHLEASREEAATSLLDALFEALGREPNTPSWQTAHRWRYALAEEPLADGFLTDDYDGVIACGDWTNGNRVEGALLAGLSAAGHILAADESPLTPR